MPTRLAVPRLATALVSLLSLFSLPHVSAQEVADTGQLQEIVITAEKRTERLQDVPISVTAISGAELAAQGITDPSEAARNMPGVALTSSGPGQTEYTIRGLSSSGPAVATVGFYLDDAPVSAPSESQNGHVSIDPDLYDLKRVEVLRGPQGTLYGSGSMGGTVKLVTNAPDAAAWDGSAAITGSHTQGGGWNGRVSGMVNIPLIEGTLALRLVGTEDHTSGWIDRVVLADFPLPTGTACGSFYGCQRGNVLASPVVKDYQNVNSKDLQSVHGALRFAPSEQFDVTATAFYQSTSIGGLDNFDNPPGTSEAHYQPYDIPEYFIDVFRLGNLVANYNLPGFQITSATSYWTRTQSQTQDVSESIQTAFDLPAFDPAAGGIGPVSVTEVDTTKQFSQEVRLTSMSVSRLQWLVGGFYSNYDYGQDQYYAGDGIAGVFGTPNLVTLLIANNLKQAAAFGEASYKITDAFKATVGLRYYSYTQHSETTLSGALSTPDSALTLTQAKNSGLNPKFTLSYDFNPDLLVYSTAAKGFRPGNGNTPVPASGPDSCLANLQALGKTNAPSQYDPDTVWSYELGEKASLFDRRLSISSAIYYERWSHVQQNVALACGFGYIDNVGEASVKGGEIEVAARITPTLTFTQSAGYTHAVFGTSEVGTGVNPGDDLLHVPQYTAATTLVFSQPINQDYRFVARGSNVLIAPSKALTYQLAELPGYDIVKLRAGIEAKRWSGFLFCDNVTDRRAFIDNVPNYLLNVPSLNRVATNQPRTIGLAFEFHK